MPIKVLIISAPGIDRYKVAEAIVAKDDSMSIAQSFTSDNVSELEQYQYYMPIDEVNLAYKNKCLLYITTEDYVSKGVTMDAMYNDTIFCMDFHNFNDITDHILLNQDVIVVWLDGSHIDHSDKKVKRELNELRYIEQRLEYIPYMYFLNEEPEEIADIVLQYANATEAERNDILEENK